MKDTRNNDFKVGIFLTLGLAFSMVAILVLGGAENAFTSKRMYLAHFPSANGLLPGAKVVLSGIPVGTVKDVTYEPSEKNVRVELGIQTKFSEHLTEGSQVEIMTQGVLGDKYVAIHPGGGNAILPEKSEIPNRPTSDVSAFLSKSDQLMVNLNSSVESLNRILRTLETGNRMDAIASGLATTSKNLAAFSSGLEGKNLNKSTRQLGEILEKINNGSGTLGALVNDPSLYEDARALVGGANRNRIIRNLVRKTAKEGAKANSEKE